MNCRFTERSISEYLEGELSAPQVLEMEEHLNSCDECRQILEDYRRLLTACRALPDYEARMELWTPIRRRLRRPAEEAMALAAKPGQPAALSMAELLQRLVLYRRVAYASIGLALLSCSVWVGQFLYQPAADAGMMSPPLELAALEVRRAEIHYQNAIESLSRNLEESWRDWSPEVRALVNQNLQTIDASIAECRAAARKDPRNPEAQSYLLAAYRKKFELLRSLLGYQGSVS